MHLINIGFTFKSCDIFIQTDSPATAERFRKFIYEHHIKPMNELLFSDVAPPGEWENPLVRPEIEEKEGSMAD